MESPSKIKIAANPKMKKLVLTKIVSLFFETWLPAIILKNTGKSGNTQGEKNVSIPVIKAVPKLSVELKITPPYKTYLLLYHSSCINGYIFRMQIIVICGNIIIEINSRYNKLVFSLYNLYYLY